MPNLVNFVSSQTFYLTCLTWFILVLHSIDKIRLTDLLILKILKIQGCDHILLIISDAKIFLKNYWSNICNYLNAFLVVISNDFNDLFSAKAPIRRILALYKFYYYY